MFCSKCGTQMTEDNMYCPRCGVKNENYVKVKSKATESLRNQSCKVFFDFFGDFPKKIVIGIVITCVCITTVIMVISLVGKFLKSEKVCYSSQGLTGYISKDKMVSFIDGREVISYLDPAIAARTTPDHKIKVVLLENKQLFLYDATSPDGVCIASDVKSINTLNNDIVYYTGRDKGHLFIYDFKKKEAQDIGFEGYSVFFSNGKNTVVGTNVIGELVSYCYINAEYKALCNIGTDAEIICVADDGSNLLWSSMSSNVFSIYI